MKSPKVIYSSESSYSGKINVWEQDGGLILEVGGYPQSVSLNTPDLPKRYWYRATEEVSQRLSNPKYALIVGLGGATIPHLFSRKFPKTLMVGVELDPEILSIARQFFSLEEIPNLAVVEGDGHKFVFSHQGPAFDLTFIDAYLGGNFPLHFNEVDFLKRLREVTSPDGWVVINRASGFPKRDFDELLSKVFASVEVVKIPLPGFLGNMGGNFLYLCR
ncbi:MAG: hypothetical protein WEC39_01930 [Patescibacteria group bacterium]